MPVATVTFDAVYAGERVRHVAGQSWVREGHAIHQGFPEKIPPGASGRDYADGQQQDKGSG